MREMIRNLKAERDTLADRVDTLTKAIALLEGVKPPRKAAKRAAPAPVVATVGGVTITPPGSVPLSRDRILRHLATAGRQTTAEIVDALCMARGPVAGAMSALYLAGKVERTTVRNPDARTRAPSLVYAWTLKARPYEGSGGGGSFD